MSKEKERRDTTTNYMMHRHNLPVMACNRPSNPTCLSFQCVVQKKKKRSRGNKREGEKDKDEKIQQH